jgi:hypothetical protein
MSHEQTLSRHTIAISISESSDMAVLGLGREHLDDARTEIARHLLALDATLMYGGDLRPEGFTQLLFELGLRHRDLERKERPCVINYFPWPVHISLSAEALSRRAEDLRGVAELVFLTLEGQVMSLAERRQVSAHPPDDLEWTTGLTAMREVLTDASSARIVLGGKVKDFKGRMPGIAEETLASLRRNKPLFLLGGFGGCARDIAQDLGLLVTPPSTSSTWVNRNAFRDFTADNLNNGLNDEENMRLATTVHVDQAVALILRGLFRQNRVNSV